MLTNIQSLRNFGIFDDFTRVAGTKDFSDRNVIYGWNYSGKTTLSRLVQAIGAREIPNDLAGCAFAVGVDGGGTVSLCFSRAAASFRI